MCGIVGFWARDGNAESLRQVLPMAVAALRHRGPDGGGLWSNDLGVGFGHRRLSIIDVSQAGAQPMVARDAEVVIVLNGEIYNHAEIAAELSRKGHVFSGRSDTEVVLAAFREWGPECVDRFIGMFAFAIWDGPKRRLSLCRDRVGVKPLYYGWDGKTLCFASELKALRSFPHWIPNVDRQAIGEFLQYGYIGQPRSVYSDIRKLPPGCWLHLYQAGDPRLEVYWSLRETLEKGPLAADDIALEEEFEALLISACRYRLVADVPVGLFLSGGVDSSLVAGILKKTGADIDTFTIGFNSVTHDESPNAARVAEALGLRNHSTRVDETDAEQVLRLWSEMFDEPHFDHAGIPTYVLAKMTRERAKVALSADGGDELFCGYATYVQDSSRVAAHARIPQRARAVGAQALRITEQIGPFDISGVVGRTVNRLMGSGLAIDRLGKAYGYLHALSGCDSIRPFRSFFQTTEVAHLLGTTYRDPRTGAYASPGLPIEQIAAMDFREYLSDNVLVKTDRATMAAGLEAREPLLDHRLVEMAFRLPLHLRHGSLGAKHLLKKILYRYVPRAAVQRPKQGFSVPLKSWMESFIASGAVHESFDTLREKLGFDPRQLEGASAVFSGSGQGLNRLWLLYVLGLWARRWA